MSDSSLPTPPPRPALLATLVGLAAVVLAGRNPRQVFLVAVFAEFLRAAVLFAFSGVLVFVYGRQDPDFSPSTCCSAAVRRRSSASCRSRSPEPSAGSARSVVVRSGCDRRPA